MGRWPSRTPSDSECKVEFLAGCHVDGVVYAAGTGRRGAAALVLEWPSLSLTELEERAAARGFKFNLLPF